MSKGFDVCRGFADPVR